jgi:endoglucanase
MPIQTKIRGIILLLLPRHSRLLRPLALSQCGFQVGWNQSLESLWPCLTQWQVTYADHYTGGSPDWTINPAWLQRVSDVVDMATSAGLYVLTNMHHGKRRPRHGCSQSKDFANLGSDSGLWADVSQPGANLTMIEEKTYASWLQIGKKLACKSELLSLEPINEPPATTAEHGAEINEINGIFLKALSDSGGFNSQRMVTLVGGSMDSIKTSEWFVPPENISNPWALQFHYYNPCEFLHL